MIVQNYCQFMLYALKINLIMGFEQQIRINFETSSLSSIPLLISPFTNHHITYVRYNNTLNNGQIIEIEYIQVKHVLTIALKCSWLHVNLVYVIW